MCSSLQQFVGSTSIKDKCQSGSSVYSHEQFGICKACYLKVLGSRKALKISVDLMLWGWQIIGAVVEGLLSQFKVSKIYAWIYQTIDHSQLVRPEHRPVQLNAHQNLKTACQTLRVITYYILKVEAKYFGFLWRRDGGR